MYYFYFHKKTEIHVCCRVIEKTASSRRSTSAFCSLQGSFSDMLKHNFYALKCRYRGYYGSVFRTSGKKIINLPGQDNYLARAR